MTAFIIAGVIAVGSVMWFFSGDDVRSHQSFGGLVAGLVVAAVIAASHFVGW